MKIRKSRMNRRDFVRASAGKAGLVAAASLLPRVHAGSHEGSEIESATEMIVGEGRQDIPYIPMTGDGPLYPPGEIAWKSDLFGAGEEGAVAQGQLLYFFGLILDSKGRPLPDAVVEIWQTDFNGNYLHPRGWGQDQLDPNFGYFGKVRTDANGFYLFKTIRPRWYMAFGNPRAAHIHLKMRHLDHGVLTTIAYFDNASHEEIAPQDPVFLRMPAGMRDRVILAEDSPQQHAALGVDFDESAICSRYDLAFLM